MLFVISACSAPARESQTGCITEKSDTGTSTVETGAQKTKSLEDILTSDSSAANIGVYGRRKDHTFYYSEDGNNWYTGFDNNGLTGTPTITADLPSDAIDLTATDATGTPRTGRPDTGAYEAR